MSFFGGSKKSEPAPAPVTQKIAASTPKPVIATAAAEQGEDKKRQVRGAGKARRGTRLTGARGVTDEASTGFKTLLGA